MIEVTLTVGGTDECEDCGTSHNGSMTLRVLPDNTVQVVMAREDGKGESTHQEVTGDQDEARYMAASNLLSNAMGICHKVLEVQPEGVLLELLKDKMDAAVQTLIVDVRRATD